MENSIRVALRVAAELPRSKSDLLKMCTTMRQLEMRIPEDTLRTLLIQHNPRISRHYKVCTSTPL